MRLTTSRLAWLLPLLGFALTYVLGVGFSRSNLDIRDEVQSIGLAAFAVFVLFGFGPTYLGFRPRQGWSRRSLAHHIAASLTAGTAMLALALAIVIVLIVRPGRRLVSH